MRSVTGVGWRREVGRTLLRHRVPVSRRHGAFSSRPFRSGVLPCLPLLFPSPRRRPSPLDGSVTNAPGRVVLEDVSLWSARAPVSESSDPMGREVHPAPDPRRSHRAHGRSGPGRPAHGDRRISGAGAHPRPRRNGARHVATTYGSRRRRGQAGHGSVAAGNGATGRRGPLRVCLGPVRVACCGRLRGSPHHDARSGRPPACQRRPSHRSPFRRTEGTGCAGRHPSGSLRHHPSRRTDQRPRFRRAARASRTWWPTAVEVSSSSRTTGPSSTAP